LAPTIDNLKKKPCWFDVIVICHILLVWSSIHIHTFTSYHCALIRVIVLAGKHVANERVYSPLTQLSHVVRLTQNLETVDPWVLFHLSCVSAMLLSSNIVKSIYPYCYIHQYCSDTKDIIKHFLYNWFCTRKPFCYTYISACKYFLSGCLNLLCFKRFTSFCNQKSGCVYFY